MRVDPSGDIVVVTGAHAHGQGTDTALAQIVTLVQQFEHGLKQQLIKSILIKQFKHLVQLI